MTLPDTLPQLLAMIISNTIHEILLACLLTIFLKSSLYEIFTRKRLFTVYYYFVLITGTFKNLIIIV